MTGATGVGSEGVGLLGVGRSSLIPLQDQVILTAAIFDGSNDHQQRGAGLTGAADAKLGILSIWVKINANAFSYILLGTTAGADKVILQHRGGGSGNRFRLRGDNGGNRMQLETAAHETTDGEYAHIMASWDVGSGTGAGSIWYNGADETANNVASDAAMDYTGDEFSIGANEGGGFKLNGAISQVYLNLSEYLDLNDANNRAKFLGPGNKPVDLGPDGSGPTGSQPILYAPNGDFSTNFGSGGNFTTTGALTFEKVN